MERVDRKWATRSFRKADEIANRSEDARQLLRLRHAIDGVGLRMYGQPIVRLADCAVIGCEALARFEGDPESTPVTWFNRAQSFGLREDLELAAVRQSLEALHDMGDNYLAINVSPQVASTTRLRRMLGQFPMDRVVLEITEHDPIDSYPGLNRALLGMRVEGLRLAIDDAGAGYASFRHILHLHPDIIKLDGTWVADIEADFARRALISALVGYAGQMDAVVIGEWVETREQAVVLRDLGVGFGQGYLFGRPKALRTA